jgi:glycerophosphoryl diester phosphodiesterase
MIETGRLSAFAAVCAALAVASCGASDTTSETGGGGSSDVGQFAVVAGPAELEDYFDCLSDERVTLISAHRGGPGPGYPENAIETFAHTLERAPALLEVDVRRTSDNVLVLLHDSQLARVSSCRGEIEHMQLANLRDCHLKDPEGGGTGFTIPTLAEALVWSEGRTVLELDIKDTVRYEDVVDAVRAANAEERVILISTSAGSAARLASLAPEMVISASIESEADLDELIDRGVAVGQIVAWTGTREVNPALNDALEARGVTVKFGTLGDPQYSIDGEIERSGDDGRYADIAADGVDAIGTDRPWAAFNALAEAAGEERVEMALESCRTSS